MENDHDDAGGVLDSGDAFDRRVSDLLEVEADLLREQAVLLLETGEVSIERPSGVVTAQFRRPRGALSSRQRPDLDLEAIAADGSGRRAGAHEPMVAKYGDRVGLVREIALALAIHLAWLEADEEEE